MKVSAAIIASLVITAASIGTAEAKSERHRGCRFFSVIQWRTVVVPCHNSIGSTSSAGLPHRTRTVGVPTRAQPSVATGGFASTNSSTNEGLSNARPSSPSTGGSSSASNGGGSAGTGQSGTTTPSGGTGSSGGDVADNSGDTGDNTESSTSTQPAETPKDTTTTQPPAGGSTTETPAGGDDTSTKPGNGNGDTNHDHTGAPGQDKDKDHPSKPEKPAKDK